ncbi:MAG: hypothetical protein Q8L60_04020 [Gammaproteobacteria bacterium]|nr:hypothetical protein [Gammaproteobacteria bacterium]MDP2139957.1 hypothetical protein [Gammaproteobacteria bacterium]MDP2347777.1 hypothetical protein [Gammaproteobacteria bacterium]
MSKKIESTAEAWESGQLGADEAFVKVASEETHDALDKCMDLKLISIRLPVSLIEEFKIIADYNQIGYQPLIRKMLQRFATAELKRMAIELYSQSKESGGKDLDPKKLQKAG